MPGPDGLPVPFRYFGGRSWTVDDRPDLTVRTEGSQFSDGREERHGHLLDGPGLTSEQLQLQGLALAATAAADEVDRLTAVPMSDPDG